MKIVIFAGGIGSRLWPLSRENSPKQFDRIFNGQSTIQLAISRVAPVFGYENIFIQTVAEYKKILKKQIPKIPNNNIIIEPSRRNLAPAVCYALTKLKAKGHKGALAILWADHLMDRVDEFITALQLSKKLIQKDPNRFIFLAERPRFANNNLGWIKVGEKSGKIENIDYYKFSGWKYRPEPVECDHMYRSGSYFWNPGYFITSIDFLIKQYRKLAPKIYNNIKEGNYNECEPIHFDSAIIEKMDLSQAAVLKTNMGWSDPGTLYALKEALEESREDNVIRGTAVVLNTSDSLIYNLEKKKLIAVIGLRGMVVVNTPDAMVVAHKDEVVNITNLVKKMKEEGLNKYL
ncbi:hypothetical protein CO115_05130 [Candidatus Falkowbacteria bacterium CG_4_9_14_3_um_filter_36_9]|uniref:Nucleotidyl transferase domain-containing protein n=2 Tax=Candidatus Falkowiibacteriota TaxID=1752728 RepID=A0A1J4T5Y2_9BACT|nr:MAG: hypothetical protein AUJ27_03380 [Candidatus Falkowbacteria bacterium CG1_02_37_44]PIV52049.1 MAG: hypothetical protein COS18_00750 [Candidatus Falkowbacteria bacterium CG02_land_8_20_14_3_00_36_14]PIX10764.1 MAG: hypothetical protein COZ73_04910 [Candidatus Falkowbacteria bacterium CG_4_8_14_3_um_filter_36_11]PJA10557.1 MAG: hypothetical protein COX67_04280 [Candidatus Falkowbacteria bacterium CG_4_10_14_0_2_um_filter_36_22]PJB18000.1 MAG: hypothetical protein CO115_05130 [Candidatus F